MVRIGLFGFERQLARRVFEAILPSGKSARLPELAHHTAIDAYLDELFHTAPAQVCLGFRLFLWFVALAPPWTIGRMTSFGRLSEGERWRVLNALKTSRVYFVREVPLFFKALACFAVLSAPATQTALLLQPADTEPPSWAREKALEE